MQASTPTPTPTLPTEESFVVEVADPPASSEDEEVTVVRRSESSDLPPGVPSLVREFIPTETSAMPMEGVERTLRAVLPAIAQVLFKFICLLFIILCFLFVLAMCLSFQVEETFAVGVPPPVPSNQSEEVSAIVAFDPLSADQLECALFYK